MHGSTRTGHRIFVAVIGSLPESFCWFAYATAIVVGYYTLGAVAAVAAGIIASRIFKPPRVVRGNYGFWDIPGVRTSWNVLLIVIGGWLGLASWTIWVTGTALAYYYYGTAIAVTTNLILGKLISPPWIVGMNIEASRRWPAFGRFVKTIKPFCKEHWPTILVFALWGVAIYYFVIFMTYDR